LKGPFPDEKKLFIGEVSTIYALSMAKLIMVQLRGVNDPHGIRADKVEETNNKVLLKLGETIVGSFSAADVQGWWISGADRGDR
jgi:hypothetical protein